jgi:hypothetical protein
LRHRKHHVTAADMLEDVRRTFLYRYINGLPHLNSAMERLVNELSARAPTPSTSGLAPTTTIT